jgi:hypothetical protein
MKKAFAAALACLLALACFATGAAAIETEEAEQSMDYITYEAHGAAGDGVTDDFDAIIAAHAAANERGLSVRANPGATYYIGGGPRTAEIQTDTDWGGAKFIIDDTQVALDNGERGFHVFRVSSKLAPVPVTGVAALKKNQEKLDWPLAREAFVVATDNTTLRFIRIGVTANGKPVDRDGHPQTDAFVVDSDGKVDTQTPIIWDFDQISSITAYPIEAETLTVRGGQFTTVANRAEASEGYYARGIAVTRSNVALDGLRHTVTGEPDAACAPYVGFLEITNCANVMVRNCVLSGRKVAVQGSYGFSVKRAANVTFQNCKQANDIDDQSLWGVMESNYMKNLVYDGCEFSRFDSHMGLTNGTVKNSVLGYSGLSVVGFGTLLVENTKIRSVKAAISLRGDYGSFWDGEVIIRNCEYVPSGSPLALINAVNDGAHDFGYPCMLPRKITVEGLAIDDSAHPFFYLAPVIVDYFNPNLGICNVSPYERIGEITLKDVTVKSGRPLLKGPLWSIFMLWDMKVKKT